MSTFKSSYSGIGEMLNSDMIVAALVPYAERVKVRAEATAPDAPPYGVGYKFEFDIETGKHGGLNHDRGYARVVNNSDHAVYVEFGNGDTDGYRTLGKALDSA